MFFVFCYLCAPVIEFPLFLKSDYVVSRNVRQALRQAKLLHKLFCTSGTRAVITRGLYLQQSSYPAHLYQALLYAFYMSHKHD